MDCSPPGSSVHEITLRFRISTAFPQPLIGILGFPAGSGAKESACNEGDLSLISGWKISWIKEWLPTQNSMVRGACGLQSKGSQGVGHDRAINTFTERHFIDGQEVREAKNNDVLLCENSPLLLIVKSCQ